MAPRDREIPFERNGDPEAFARGWVDRLLGAKKLDTLDSSGIMSQVVTRSSNELSISP